MIGDFVKNSKVYLVILILLGVIFFCVSNWFNSYIIKIDEWFSNFIMLNVNNDYLTMFMKVITHLGSAWFFIVFLLIVLVLISNKKVCYLMSINLFFTYILSVVFKNIFRRERPLFMLIERPFDFSFPSGHTMCSIVFYGFLIYLICKFVRNVYIKRVINIFIVIIMALIPFSRLYLGVHFFTDVIAGMILGIVCLLSFINYVKIKELI